VVSRACRVDEITDVFPQSFVAVAEYDSSWFTAQTSTASFAKRKTPMLFAFFGLGVPEIIALLFVFPITILLFVFWIWTLIDCITNEPSQGNDKIIWVLVIVFLHGLGSLLYFFVRRPQRIRDFGK
jgi:hypothetical protein